MSQQLIDFGKDRDQMTRAELRASIAHKTGHRPDISRLTKPVLNSVHAYLTGEFAYPQSARHRVPRRKFARETLPVVQTHDDHPEDIETNEDGYTPVGVYIYEGDFDFDTMRRAALREICQTMDNADDEREWTP